MTSETMQYWEHAESLIDQGDLIGAWRSLEAHDAMRTDNASARTVLGRVLRLRGLYSEARELLQRAVISSPRCPGVLIELGRIAFELGDADGAGMWHRHAYQDDMPGEGWVADWLDVLIRLAKFTQLTTLINNQAGTGFPSTPGTSTPPPSTGGNSWRVGKARRHPARIARRLATVHKPSG
jgi:tetratricopeptide (TPR) repeat protein